MCIKKIIQKISDWWREYQSFVMLVLLTFLVVLLIYGIITEVSADNNCEKALKVKGYSTIIVKRIEKDFECQCKDLTVDKAFPKLYNNYLEGKYTQGER